MRMSLLQSFNQGLRSILDIQSRQAHTQNQVATGRRVLQPSDDPLAAARILQVEREQSRLTQFQKNIDGVESSLMLEDTQLEAVGNLLLRVRELATKAGNGSLGYSERQGLAAELETRLAELLNLANTRNTTGEYIFGGYQGEQPPFVEAEGEDTITVVTKVSAWYRWLPAPGSPPVTMARASSWQCPRHVWQPPLRLKMLATRPFQPGRWWIRRCFRPTRAVATRSGFSPPSLLLIPPGHRITMRW